jgi:hypothetical protein
VSWGLLTGPAKAYAARVNIRPLPPRALAVGLACVALAAVVAWPAFAADPSGSPSGAPSGSIAPSGSTAPSASLAPAPSLAPAASTAPAASIAPAAPQAPEATAKPKPSKAPKAAKGPEVDVSATGTLGVRQDGQGRPEYTLTNGATVRVLSAGPPWYYVDHDNPLEAFVGDQVTIAGTARGTDTEIDVLTVDGTAIREPGKPPWAGGWKRVGEGHPGWSQAKADRFAAKARENGVDCWPPGHCKDQAGAAATERPGGD